MTGLFNVSDFAILSREMPRDDFPTVQTHPEIVSELTRDDIELIESSREGYSRVVRHYLDNGHRGVKIVRRGIIVALGWLWVNEGATTTRVKGYFPVSPGEAYFHADWTAPAARGQGLHSNLIVFRMLLLHREGFGGRLVANMSHSNLSSMKNYERAGFHVSGELRVRSFLKWPLSVHLLKEDR
ncbi:GNAT family N-acetyltransferase [Microbacterium sp.]|uniref:GNAT family N-acetyltransferase n=1 Tax=Microbacterium sp. TaxID=51671 RepID=UPI002811EE87|nr:hypothetical protein [Microbacterium sp.]